MCDKKAILIGYSGHGYVVAEAALEDGVDIIGYSEKHELLQNPLGLKYLGFEKDEDFIGWHKDVQFIIGIGDNRIRQSIANFIASKNKKLLTVVSSSASISGTANLGDGVLVARNVSVNALAVIGNNVILNTGCIIEHECILGNGVHIAPGAVLAGNVLVGEGSFVGANSVVRQGVKIGNNVTIGAGSVVVKDVPDNEIWAGNPAKVLK